MSIELMYLLFLLKSTKNFFDEFVISGHKYSGVFELIEVILFERNELP